MKFRNRSPASAGSNRGRDAPFLPDTDQYVAPEVFVQKVGDDFTVTTNDDRFPHLRISNVYKDLMSQGENNAEVKNYIREKIRAGKFLIKSLHQRQQTICQHRQGNRQTPARLHGKRRRAL